MKKGLWIDDGTTGFSAKRKTQGCKPSGAGGNNNPDYNCAAFCTFGVEGELDESWVSPSDMDDELRQAYINLQSESDAQIGAVVVFSETFEEFDFIWGYEAGGPEKSRKYYDENIKNRGAHYPTPQDIN